MFAESERQRRFEWSDDIGVPSAPEIEIALKKPAGCSLRFPLLLTGQWHARD